MGLPNVIIIGPVSEWIWNYLHPCNLLIPSLVHNYLYQWIAVQIQGLETQWVSSESPLGCRGRLFGLLLWLGLPHPVMTQCFMCGTINVLTLKYHTFSWHKLKNDIPKIKWLLFLNPFDYRENATFFSLKIFSAFDWIQIIVVVSLETQWSQVTPLDKSPFRFEGNIIKNEHSFLFLCLFYVVSMAVFQKGHLETLILWVLWSVKYCNYSLLNYTTLFILKISFCTSPYLSLSPTSLSQTLSPCSYPQTATNREDYKK